MQEKPSLMNRYRMKLDLCLGMIRSSCGGDRVSFGEEKYLEDGGKGNKNKSHPNTHCHLPSWPPNSPEEPFRRCSSCTGRREASGWESRLQMPVAFLSLQK